MKECWYALSLFFLGGTNVPSAPLWIRHWPWLFTSRTVGVLLKMFIMFTVMYLGQDMKHILPTVSLQPYGIAIPYGCNDTVGSICFISCPRYITVNMMNIFNSTPTVLDVNSHGQWRIQRGAEGTFVPPKKKRERAYQHSFIRLLNVINHYLF